MSVWDTAGMVGLACPAGATPWPLLKSEAAKVPIVNMQSYMPEVIYVVKQKPLPDLKVVQEDCRGHGRSGETACTHQLGGPVQTPWGTLSLLHKNSREPVFLTD